MILTADELAKAAPRIEQVAALEEIGRSVGQVAAHVRDAMVLILTPYH